MESSNPEKCGRPRPHNNVQVVSDRPVPVTLRLEGKAMFSRLTAFIHQAAEQVVSLAPPVIFLNNFFVFTSSQMRLLTKKMSLILSNVTGRGSRKQQLTTAVIFV